ncbi:predicted protein [Phaeodactylum tricornutum CCAP 1055/1]|uniref:Uncharacterized protein n=1 Tax=Phaeodactylum tricornutum (strain CCAP 1055/1) TaxID=556484 RepID=B7G5U7_PHATC|nr:predicted protein [Phaeodactylum tricornutum CCAP 1055/1]EEC45754.1 predicted protein [Phaeodactylum tricornutum CCAP 1055/1]|eukprot:XP_002182467.1 predicted protein [Phaeodactylum tricornutum CCAP 1055/1]
MMEEPLFVLDSSRQHHACLKIGAPIGKIPLSLCSAEIEDEPLLSFRHLSRQQFCVPNRIQRNEPQLFRKAPKCRKQLVHFGSVSSDGPLTIPKDCSTVKVSHTPDPCKGDSSRHDLWLNDNDIRRFQRCARARASVYVALKPHYARSILALTSNPFCTSFSHGEASTSYHIETIAFGHARGLEQRIVPQMRTARKRAVSHVLLMQEKLKQDNFVDRRMMELLIQQKAQESSRRSRQLALQLAKADALAARRIHQMPCHSQNSIVITPSS